MTARHVTAVRLGDEGFVRYLHDLHELGVLTHDEVVSWLGLHGALLRAAGTPLDDQTFEALQRELGA